MKCDIYKFKGLMDWTERPSCVLTAHTQQPICKDQLSSFIGMDCIDEDVGWKEDQIANSPQIVDSYHTYKLNISV